MNWAKLILTVVTEAWEAWRSRKVEPEEPVASQRDIAIGVAAGEAARREGKIASSISREAQELGAATGRSPEAHRAHLDELSRQQSQKTHANAPKRMMTESAMREECARIKAACPVCAQRTNSFHCSDCTLEKMKAFYGVEILPDKLEDTWPGERK